MHMHMCIDMSACHASASASGRTTTSLAVLGARRARPTSRRARWGFSRARLVLRFRLRDVGGHCGRRASTIPVASASLGV